MGMHSIIILIKQPGEIREPKGREHKKEEYEKIEIASLIEFLF